MEYQKDCAVEEEAIQKVDGACRHGITESEVAGMYQQWATAYEQDMSLAGYRGPQFGAEVVSETLGGSTHARILDAACGTGWAGKMLKSKGFQNLDGLDASREMLDLAKQQGLYEHYYEAYMNKSRLPIEDDTYDLVLTVGSFIPGHVKEDCFEEMVRITKPGGYFAIVMNERYFLEDRDHIKNLEPRMRELQEAGVWTRMRRDVKTKYIDQYSAVVYVFRMQPEKNKALLSLTA